MKVFKYLLGLSLIASACSEEVIRDHPYEPPFDALEWGIFELQDAYAKGSLSIYEATDTYLNRIASMNHEGPKLHAVISVNPEALVIADSLDRMYKAGEILGPLHGIPVILKDNIESLDSMPTTAGSRALSENYVFRDSKVAQKLREAGAIILAKANLSEWANFRGQSSISGWSGLGGFTRNPYVLSRNPCGSSAGSAVAVAAGLAPIAIGTETNGSIVCPSQTNGVVGLKPTVGFVAGARIIPIAHSQDVAGPMAKTVAEVALVMEVLADPDPANPARFENWPPQDWSFALEEGKSLEGMRIGIFTAALGEHAGVDSLFAQARRDFSALGAELVEIPELMTSGTGYHSYQVMLYEYNHDLNAYFASLGEKASIGSIQELIEFNKTDSIELLYFNQAYLEQCLEYTDSDAYEEHLAAMHLGSRKKGIDHYIDSLQLEAIIAPTGSPAWQIDPINGDHHILGSSSPAAISGYPNLTVPMGFDGELPLGISIFGPFLSEQKLLQIGAVYEAKTKHRKVPQFLATDPELSL